MSKPYTPATAAAGVEEAIRLLEGRWKLLRLWREYKQRKQKGD